MMIDPFMPKIIGTVAVFFMGLALEGFYIEGINREALKKQTEEDVPLGILIFSRVMYTLILIVIWTL